jgi:hypothetical protein
MSTSASTFGERTCPAHYLFLAYSKRNGLKVASSFYSRKSVRFEHRELQEGIGLIFIY